VKYPVKTRLDETYITNTRHGTLIDMGETEVHIEDYYHAFLLETNCSNKETEDSESDTWQPRVRTAKVSGRQNV
jgi:hypothetical protein